MVRGRIAPWRPDDADSKLAFAQSLFAIGNYSDSAFLFRRALELRPDWPDTEPSVLDRYGNTVDHQEQILAVRTFLGYMAEDPSASFVLAVESFLSGNVPEARALLQKLRELDPEDHSVQRLLEACDKHR